MSTSEQKKDEDPPKPSSEREGSIQSVHVPSDSSSAPGEEALSSFGEPLHVSVSRGTARFQSIQRAYSKQPPTVAEEEAGAPAEGFDVVGWLRGKKEFHGPPFAKRFGLVFDDLDIYGTDVSNKHISSLITPFWKLIKTSYRGFGLVEFLFGGEKKLLIRKMSGEVKEGEMLLVLGRPGSGCSTLLRVLGNLRKSYTHIDGLVSYGGLSPEEVSQRFRGEVAYNQEEDVHFPTLTVRKTLDFAIHCKTLSRQVLVKREAYKKEILEVLLEIYGLTGCADTIVGSAFLRGVSGGERKRVSIAEQMACGASVSVWDGSTRGLDSSSALDYVRSLRISADLLQTSSVVTIYQASQNIYDLFDKVLVIDEGRQLYFGPADKAVEYFASIGIYKPPRQTTSDFLTGLTQLNERKVIPGWEERAPKTAEEFEDVWRNSAEYQAVKEEVLAYHSQLIQDDRGQEIREFVNQTKMGTAKSKLRRMSPYTTTFVYQLRRLVIREWEMFLGNPSQIIFLVVYNIAFAIIVGTLFIRLPKNTSSFFTRGGVLFFSLLFNTLTSLSEIPKAVTGREVVYKHKRLAMYHPAALSLSQTIVNMPFSLFQVVIFSSILYWAVGLQRTAGHFLSFILFLYAGSLCLTAFYRLIGNSSPNVDFGHTASGISLLFMILYVGYLIPPPLMHKCFKWVYWINPLAYAFKALITNELKSVRYPCDHNNLIPEGPGIGIANQVCTIAGSNPGELYVSGREYLSRGYHIYSKDEWKNFIAVVCFWVLFVLMIATVMEFVEFGNRGYTINVFKRYPPHVAQVSRENIETDEAADKFGPVPKGGPTDDQIATATTYTWKHVNYTVPVKGGERKLLDDVSG
ncbi:ATP-binding cassette transporter snq2, partial [Dipsacomyces acuminosporus]